MSDLDIAGLATVWASLMVLPSSCDSGYDSNSPNGSKLLDWVGQAILERA